MIDCSNKTTHLKGQDAVIIGKIVEQHPGMLTARTSIGGTSIGGTRVIAMQIGEQLPRIC